MKSFNYTKISEKLLTQAAIKSRKYDYYNNGCLNLSKISNLHRKRYVLGWRFLVVAEKPYGIIVGENM